MSEGDVFFVFFFFQAEDGIRDTSVTGVQTCALPIFERGDVDPGRVEAALERLHECRPRARERIEHVLAAAEVACEQDLDELRDELPEIGMEAVYVLRATTFGHVAFRPRQVETDVRVEPR